ncbi:uncharacterized protein LOC124357871 [Homalodisca vitripennis]|nr:uncharacterized protein LOC124357871 [Homalodisca vitripennis]
MMSSAVDSDSVTCLLPEYASPRLVKLIDSKDLGCKEQTFWDWVQGRAEGLEDVENWFLRRGVHAYHTLLMLLMVGSTVVVLAFVIRGQRQRTRTVPSPVEVPYTIIGDKDIFV